MVATKLIFHHIPKAAGSTFSSSLAVQYPPKSVFKMDVKAKNEERLEALTQMTPSERSGLQLILGHMPLGAHRLFDEKCDYYAFVREPVSRVLSLCAFIRSREHHYLNAPYQKMNWDTAQLVRSGLTNETSNEMVRYFCYPETLPENESPTREHLEQAKQNVESLFPSVGLSNQYDASVVVFAAIYGTKAPFYMRRNSRKKSEKETPSSAVIEAIQETNQLDLDFYDYLEQRFQRQLKELLESDAKVLCDFKQSNQQYGQYLYGLRACIRKYIKVI